MRVTWLGHSTVILDVAGTRLVTDPVLRGRVAHLRRQVAPAPAPADVDAVLLSHGHRDHLDLPSLRAIDAPILAPPTTRRTLRRFALRTVGPGDTVQIGDVTVTAVQAVHDGRRWHLGPRRSDDAIGFVVAGEGLSTYFAGDTDLFDDMAKLRPVDVALLPIAGWGPTLGPGHMDASAAAAALALLSPRIAVPIHWGTFRARNAMREDESPAVTFKRCALAADPSVRVEVLQPGDSLVVKPREQRC